MAIHYKQLALKSANKIRRNKGLPELTLSFFEESEHPRNHGRFAPKGTSSNNSTSEFNGESYNREEIRNKIKEQDSKERKHKLFKGLLTSALSAGIIGTALAGHPHIAVGLAAGWTGIELAKLANKARKAAGKALLKYTARKLVTPPKLPFVGKNAAELIRGEGHTGWIDI